MTKQEQIELKVNHTEQKSESFGLIAFLVLGAMIVSSFCLFHVDKMGTMVEHMDKINENIDKTQKNIALLTAIHVNKSKDEIFETT